MCDVPSIAVFCGESIECCLCMASKFLFKSSVTIPVVSDTDNSVRLTAMLSMQQIYEIKPMNNGVLKIRRYSRINATKSPAKGTGNFSEPRQMSQVGRVREVVCA
jgi:hypothetical protein